MDSPASRRVLIRGALLLLDTEGHRLTLARPLQRIGALPVRDNHGDQQVKIISKLPQLRLPVRIVSCVSYTST